MASERPVVVIGSATLDAKAKLEREPSPGGSVPGQIRVTAGGVARNIAESLARFELPTALISAVGDDPLGDFVLGWTARAGVDVSPSLRVAGGRTNSYIAMLQPGGSLGWAVDDMGALDALSPERLDERAALIQSARFVVADNNLPAPTLDRLVTLCRGSGVRLVADPTRAYLAPRLKPYLPAIHLITPNQQEAAALTGHEIVTVADALQGAVQLVRAGVKMALITMGDMDVVYATARERGHIAAPKVEVVDLTGGSDAMTATVVYGLLNDFPADEAVRLAVTAASLTIGSHESVRSDLSLELLYDSMVV